MHLPCVNRWHHSQSHRRWKHWEPVYSASVRLSRKYPFPKKANCKRLAATWLQNCTSLEKVHLPDSVTVISTSMFYGCHALYKVVAGGVDTIEDYAFFGDEKLRVVSIRRKKIIASQAFEGCDPTLMIEYLQ